MSAVSVDATLVNVKGQAVNGLAGFLQKELTAGQMAQLRAGLAAEDGPLLDGRLLANDKVPVERLNRITVRAAEIAGQPVFEFARRAGRFGGEMAVRTVYKFLLALLSPESVLRTCPTMWARVYDAGRVTIEAAEGRGTIRVDDFPAHPALCGRITGWFDFIGRQFAKHSHFVHDRCRARGDDTCLWIVTWWN